MNICPKYLKCPIFIENVLSSERMGKTFRKLYCEAGPEVYRQCKRFIVSEKTGKPVPADILPSSSLSVDEIIKTMK